MPIVIIGAGFSGIGAALRLVEAGYDDFVVLERDTEVGGVWRDNRYPHCACDIESHLYSFSFAPNPRWSRRFSPRAEIAAYLRECVEGCGLGSRLRLGCALESARWDAARGCWALETSAGPLRADVVIAAMGALNEPKYPEVRGRGRFAGPSFHTARWDPSVDLRGRRVGVVGTGASAIQVVPGIQAEVERLVVFQRTAAWVKPRRDRAYSPLERRLFAAVPVVHKLIRAGLYLRHESFILGFRNPAIMRLAARQAAAYLEREIADPKLREKLRPDFTYGCKRILLSDDYYAALGQPHVELVAAGVDEVVGEGLVDSEGRTHELDVIIWATGFHVHDPPFAALVRGRSGDSLAERWRGSPRALLGTMVADFPNLFTLTGPNTGLGHSSMILMIEAQLELILGALRTLDGGAREIEPRPEAQARFNAAIDEGTAGTVWTAGGCSSWYLDASGRNSALWPWSTYAFMRQAKFEAEDYLVR